MSREREAATWLGIAGGILAILAFAGVTNLDDLKAAFDPDAGSRKACTKAWSAWEDHRETINANTVYPYEDRQSLDAEAGSAYSEQLSGASKLTDESDLKTALSDHSAVEKRNAQYRQQTGKILPGAGRRTFEAQTTWETLCKKYFSDD